MSRRKAWMDGKKKILEKIEELKEQRNSIVEYVDEIVESGLVPAKELLEEKDKTRFLAKYMPTVQKLEQCMSSLFVIRASMPGEQGLDSEDSDSDVGENIRDKKQDPEVNQDKTTISKQTGSSGPEKQKITATSIPEMLLFESDPSQKKQDVRNHQSSKELESHFMTCEQFPVAQTNVPHESAEVTSEAKIVCEGALSDQTKIQPCSSSQGSPLLEKDSATAMPTATESCQSAQNKAPDTTVPPVQDEHPQDMAQADLGPNIPHMTVQENTPLAVVVSEVVNPSLFWVQPVDKVLDNLVEEMCLHYGAVVMTTAFKTLPRVGMAVSACYSVDNTWYRARITGVHPPSSKVQAECEPDLKLIGKYEVDVLYIDYGNRETIPLDRVRELDPKFAKHPGQAFCCALAKVGPPVGSTWTSEQSLVFGKMVLQKDLQGYFSIEDGCALLFITLYFSMHPLKVSKNATIGSEDQLCNVGELMISLGHGRPVTNAELARSVMLHPNDGDGDMKSKPSSETQKDAMSKKAKPSQEEKTTNSKPKQPLAQVKESSKNINLSDIKKTASPRKKAKASEKGKTKISSRSPTANDAIKKQMEKSPEVQSVEKSPEVQGVKIHKTFQATKSTLDTKHAEKGKKDEILSDVQPRKSPKKKIKESSEQSQEKGKNAQSDIKRDSWTELVADENFDKCLDSELSKQSQYAIASPANLICENTTEKEPGMQNVEVKCEAESNSKQASLSESENTDRIESTTPKTPQEKLKSLGFPVKLPSSYSQRKEFEKWMSGDKNDTAEQCTGETKDTSKQPVKVDTEIPQEQKAVDLPKHQPENTETSEEITKKGDEESNTYRLTINSEEKNNGTHLSDTSAKVKTTSNIKSINDGPVKISSPVREQSGEDKKDDDKYQENKCPQTQEERTVVRDKVEENIDNTNIQHSDGKSEPSKEISANIQDPIPAEKTTSTIGPPLKNTWATWEKPNQGPLTFSKTALSPFPVPQIEIPEDGCLSVMMSHIESPNEFYVHICSAETAVVDNLMDDLNKHYKKTEHSMLSKFFEDFEPKKHDPCVAKFSKDGSFYRGEVIGLRYETNQDESASCYEVKVFYIDFGNSEWVKKSRVFPCAPKFRELPPLAIVCSLADVSPKVPEKTPMDSEKTTDGWLFKAVRAFEKHTGYEKMLRAYVVKTGTIPPLRLILVDTNDIEDVWINEELVKLGYANPKRCGTPGMESSTPGSDRGAAPSAVEEMFSPNKSYYEEDMSKWDPMMEDFLSERNSYEVDIDDPGVATTGYKAKDESRICIKFNSRSGCRRRNCPFEHVKFRPGGTTSDQKEVYWLSDVDNTIPCPAEDTWVVLEITAVCNPGHFYAFFPFGTKPLEKFMEEENTPADDGYEGSLTCGETLESMMDNLNEHCNQVTFHGKDLIAYGLGEIVVAKFTEDGLWYRARVTNTDIENKLVKVFYLDFGNSEWLPEDQVHIPEPQFLHLPFQAIECFLAGVEANTEDGVWSKEARAYFSDLTDGKTLFAYVQLSGWNSSIHVQLYETGDEDLNIAEALIKAGYAREVPITERSTGRSSRSNFSLSRSRSSSESSEKYTYMPG